MGLAGRSKLGALKNYLGGILLNMLLSWLYRNWEASWPPVMMLYQRIY
jgi:hypothetical protein